MDRNNEISERHTRVLLDFCLSVHHQLGKEI